MATLNKVYLIGNVGRDPDVRETNTGKVASFSLATAMRYKDRNGEQKEETEWHNVVVWGSPAEYVENHVRKGTQLHVEGRIRYRKYTDKNGDTKFVTEIVANSLQNLSPKRGSEESVADGPDLPF